jgi:hypothetical protein
MSNFNINGQPMNSAKVVQDANGNTFVNISKRPLTIIPEEAFGNNDNIDENSAGNVQQRN